MMRFLAVVVLTACAAAGQPSRGPRVPPGKPVVPVDPLTQPARVTAAAPMDVGGSWKGVITSGEMTVALADLELVCDAAKRTVTGELRYTTVPNPLDRVRPVQGGWKVKGIVDPGARAVVLGPDGNAAAGSGGVVQPQEMGAVYSAGRGELAGQVRTPFMVRPDAAFFVFARSEGMERMKTLASHAAAAQGVHKPVGSGPDDGAVKKWADRYVGEYTKAGTLAPTDLQGVKGMALLEDAAFQPVFGETFDAIEYGALTAAMRRLNAMPEYGWAQYVLRSPAPQVVGAAAMRTIEAWEQEMLAHFTSDPPASSHFDDVAAVQAAVKERVVWAWPSDQKSVDAKFEEIRSRSGGSALTASVDKAVSGAAGLEGAKALAAWAKENEANLRYATAEERAAAIGKVNATLDELLVGLLGEPLRRLDSLGSGEAAVRAGAQWHKAFVAQFGFAQDRPPVQEALARLAARREKDLASGRGELLSKIAGCTKEEEIDALFAGELGVPSDARAGAYTGLQGAAADRRKQIQSDFRLSLFAEDEKPYFVTPGVIDPRKGAGKPPSKEAIRLAFVRSFGAEPGKIIDPHTVRHVTRQQASLLMPFPVIMTFSDEDLASAVPIEDAKGKETGDFDCEFTLVLQMKLTDDNALANYDEVVRKTLDKQLEVMNGVMRSVKSLQHETLRLTERGFIIPRLEDNAVKEALFDAFLSKGR